MITVRNATYDKCKKHPLTTKSSTDYCCSTHIYDDKNMTIKLNMGKLNLAHSISLIGISLNIDVACFIYYRIYKLNLTIEHTMNMVCRNIWSKARQRWNHMRYTNVSINDATSMAKYLTSLTLQAAVTARTLSTYFYSSHHPIWAQHWSWILHEPHTSGGTKLFSSLYNNTLGCRPGGANYH